MDPIIKTKTGDLEFRRRVSDSKDWGVFRLEDGTPTKTRVSVVTGKPISQRLENIICRLLGANPVDNAEIEATDEVKEMRRAKKRAERQFHVATSLRSTAEIKTKEREAIRDSILAELHGATDIYKGFKYTPARGKRLDIVLGIPAAGKSTLVVLDLVKEHKGRVCDADDIKERLPEYAGGIGADLLIDEANALNAKALLAAAGRGDNVVYPIIGADPVLVEFLITKAHQIGYEVHLHLAKSNRDIAKGRLLNRMVGKGRFTELDYFENAVANSERTFRALARKCESATEHITYEKGI